MGISNILNQRKLKKKTLKYALLQVKNERVLLDDLEIVYWKLYLPKTDVIFVSQAIRDSLYSRGVDVLYDELPGGVQYLRVNKLKRQCKYCLWETSLPENVSLIADPVGGEFD
jgi:hypothetical protein